MTRNMILGTILQATVVCVRVRFRSQSPNYCLFVDGVALKIQQKRMLRFVLFTVLGSHHPSSVCWQFFKTVDGFCLRFEKTFLVAATKRILGVIPKTRISHSRERNCNKILEIYRFAKVAKKTLLCCIASSAPRHLFLDGIV